MSSDVVDKLLRVVKNRKFIAVAVAVFAAVLASGVLYAIAYGLPEGAMMYSWRSAPSTQYADETAFVLSAYLMIIAGTYLFLRFLAEGPRVPGEFIRMGVAISALLLLFGAAIFLMLEAAKH